MCRHGAASRVAEVPDSKRVRCATQLCAAQPYKVAESNLPCVLAAALNVPREFIQANPLGNGHVGVLAVAGVPYPTFVPAASRRWWRNCDDLQSAGDRWSVASFSGRASRRRFFESGIFRQLSISGPMSCRS